MAQNKSQSKVVAHWVNNWLTPTQNWIYSQVQALRTWQPVVFTNRVNGLYPEDLVVNWEQQPVWRRFLDRVFMKVGLRQRPVIVTKGIRKYRIPILHSHFAQHGARNAILAQREGLKHVVSVYGADVSKNVTGNSEKTQALKRMFRMADAIVCEGPAMAERVCKLGCARRKVHVIAIPIDFSALPFQKRRVTKNTPLQILIAGTFTEKKGIPDALEAIGRLRKRKPDFRIRVTVVGDAVRAADIMEKRRILAKVQQWNLQDVVDFLGYVKPDKLRGLYYAHDLLLSPSITAENGDTEGGAPVTLSEAAATGLPIVSTWHCDIPEVVKHRFNGFLVPERDVDGLVEKLFELAEDLEKREMFGRNGAIYVRKRHSRENSTLQLASLYDSLITR